MLLRHLFTAMRAGLFWLVCSGCSLDPPPPHVVPPIGPEAATPPAIHLVIRDGDSLQKMPARAIIYGSVGTPRPDFKSDGATGSVLAQGAIGSPEGVLLPSGEATFPIPSGTYELWLLQGTEYELVRKTVTVAKDAVTEVDVTLEHTVFTNGWLAADMHVHSARSVDSRVLAAHRVVTEVVSGVHVIVPTEHHFHNDLGSMIELLGLGSRAVSIPGSEYDFQGGHAGVYPVVFKPNEPLWGAPAWQQWPKFQTADPPTYFPLIHQQEGQPVIVINHPRLGGLGYFVNLGWRPELPHPTAALFDGMEVLNGYAMRPAEVSDLLHDWFALLNQGHRITGAANSDSHRMDWLRAGYPRTYLGLPTSDPARVLPADLRQALLQQRAVGTNGPFVRLVIDQKELGQTVTVKNQTVQANIVADAPGWIDLTRIQLYVNGVMTKEIPVTDRKHPALKTEVALEMKTDGWVVVLALGDSPLPVDVIGASNGGQAYPIAFTNPIWLDANGDGKVNPPGTVPPRPLPWKPAANVAKERSAVWEVPHAPLYCDPFEYPDPFR